MKTVGDRIREEREKQGITQDELARRLGYVHRSAVSKIEKKRSMSLKSIQKIADALNISASYLIGFEDEINVKADIDKHDFAVKLEQFDDPIMQEFLEIKAKVKPEIIKRFLDLMIDSYGIELDNNNSHSD